MSMPQVPEKAVPVLYLNCGYDYCPKCDEHHRPPVCRSKGPMRDIDLDNPAGDRGRLTAAFYDAVIAAVDPERLETTRLLSDGETAAVIAPCSYPEGIYPPRSHLVVVVPVDEPGTLCAAYGGTMPDGRVRICSKDRWHGDSHTYEFGLVPDACGGAPVDSPGLVVFQSGERAQQAPPRAPRTLRRLVAAANDEDAYCVPGCPDDVCRMSGHCAWPVQ